MRSLPLLAAGAMLCACSLGWGQTTRPASPSTAPAAPVVGAATQPATTRPATTRPVARPLPSADSFLPALGNDAWQMRLRAVDDLVRMGEDARPIIKELLNRKLADAEVRARLETALTQIDENRAVGTSYITMHMHDAAPKDVFAELSRQCYADLKPAQENLFDDAGQPRVDIDIDRLPFWSALSVISAKTGIDLQPYNDGVRLTRGGFRANSPWSTVQGAFLIIPTTLSRSQVVMLANGGASSDFSMQLMAYSEPKLHVLSSNAGVKLREVIDDAGNSLVPTTHENRGYYGGSGGSWNLYCQLAYPEHPGKKITRFSGTATFTIQTKSEKIEIPDAQKMKDLSRVIGDMPIVFHDLKKNGPTWELHLTTTITPQRWAQFSQSVQTQLKLLDATGQPLDHRGMRSGGNMNGMDFTILFGSSIRANGRASADPVLISWEVPTGSKEVSVNFEFKDLPMPK